MATTEGFNPRARLIFAAPLQLGMLAEHELADLYLSERLTVTELRHRLAEGMPAGYRVVELHDVWVGAPAIAPQLAAADYRLTVLHVDPDRLRGAADALLAAETLPRHRRKEGREIPYDLRPLLIDLRVTTPEHAGLPPDVGADEAAGLWLRLRHSQDRGSGRAEEVVAALADRLGLASRVSPVEGEAETRSAAGRPDGAGTAWTAPSPDTRAVGGPPVSELALEVVRPVRERLWLAAELDPIDPPAQVRPLA